MNYVTIKTFESSKPLLYSVATDTGTFYLGLISVLIGKNFHCELVFVTFLTAEIVLN